MGTHRPVAAGAIYFASAFGLGFALGTVRVFVVVPRLGDLAGVTLELPIMLGATWFFCRIIAARFAVSGIKARSAMGIVAFVLLMAAELALALALGTSLDRYFAHFATAAGVLGLAGQIAFATFPLLQSSHSGAGVTPGWTPMRHRRNAAT